MDVNQFAVYQLKNIPENRQMRFRPYGALQEKGIQIRCKDYEQVYLGRMQPGDGPEQIRKRFERKLPRTFHGHSISVSDVLVLNKAGVVTSYYVEKEGFAVIAGFIRKSSSGALVSFDTVHFHIEGKEGSWLAFDSIIINGRQFFLMEHETYRKQGAWTVVDEDGKLIVDNVYHGFDQSVQQQIKDYLNPMKSEKDPVQQEISSGQSSIPSRVVMPFGISQEKPLLENWQKYMENGEYLRSIESGEEQNYSFIDGNKNNCKKNNGRKSVLKKLRQKQAEIAKRSGKPAQQMETAADMERKRK